MNKPVANFGPKDRALISRALGELAASLDIAGDKRLYRQAVNIMNRWDSLPRGVIQLPTVLASPKKTNKK